MDIGASIQVILIDVLGCKFGVQGIQVTILVVRMAGIVTLM